MNLLQEKTARGRGHSGLGPVARGDNAYNILRFELAPSHIHQRANDISHHMPQKAAGFNCNFQQSVISTGDTQTAYGTDTIFYITSRRAKA
jgi:hypothetical protein